MHIQIGCGLGPSGSEFLLYSPNALKIIDNFDATDIARRSKALQVTGYAFCAV